MRISPSRAPRLLIFLQHSLRSCRSGTHWSRALLLPLCRTQCMPAPRSAPPLSPHGQPTSRPTQSDYPLYPLRLLLSKAFVPMAMRPQRVLHPNTPWRQAQSIVQNRCLRRHHHIATAPLSLHSIAAIPLSNHYYPRRAMPSEVQNPLPTILPCTILPLHLSLLPALAYFLNHKNL